MSDLRKSDFDIEPEPKPKLWRLRKMRARHRRIAEMHATGTMTQQQIAEKLNVTQATVSVTLRQPLVKAYLARLNAAYAKRSFDMMETIAETAELAAIVNTEIMLDDKASAATRSSIAKDFMDRAGFGAVKRTEDVTKRVTADDIAKLKAQHIMAAKKNGLIEDAEVINEDSN